MPDYYTILKQNEAKLKTIVKCIYLPCLVFELSVLIVFIHNLRKRKSDLRNPYFILTFLMMIVDFIRVVFLPIDWELIQFTAKQHNVEMFYDNLQSIWRVYLVTFIPACLLFMTINRLNAVCSPVLYKNIWSTRNSIVLVSIPLIVPVVFCFVMQNETSAGFHIAVASTGLLLCFVSTICMLFVGFKYYRTVTSEKMLEFQAVVEKRLLITSMFSNTTGVCFYLLRFFSVSFMHFQKIGVRLDPIVLYYFVPLADVVYIVHHYGSVLILLLLSNAVYHPYLKLYRIDKVLPKWMLRSSFASSTSPRTATVSASPSAKSVSRR